MKTKRILAFVLALLLALGCCGTAFAAEGDSQVVDFLPETKPAMEDDLYGAVNFDTLKEAEIQPGYGVWSVAAQLDLEISEALNEILDECVANAGTYEKGSPEQKIADLYLSYVDEDSRNAAGIEPIRPYLDAINAASTIQEYVEAMAAIEGEIGYYSLLSFAVSEDLYDSSRYVVGSNVADLGLGKEYLLDESMSDYWDAYKTLVTKLFVLYGLGEDEAAEKAENVFALQTELSKSTLSAEEYYDFNDKSYQPKSMDDVKAMLPTVDLGPVFEKEGLPMPEEVLVTDPGQLQAVGQLLTEENLPQLKDYSTAVLLVDVSGYASMDFRQAAQEYNIAVTGIAPKELAEAGKDAVEGDLAWDFGKVYVEKYFPEESKQIVLDMVDEIVAWFSDRIDQLDWMGEETKEAAHRKLDALNVKIGYPDNYDFIAYLDDVEYLAPADGGCYLENQLAASRVTMAYTRGLLTKPVDKSAWGMTPQTVNCYYSSTSNEIVFPAAILQPPFFDPDASRAANLGGIGSTIAHELTHAFDSSGAQFDENGNLNMWWTDEDYANFTALQQDIVDAFGAVEMPDGLSVNGELTLGENIADLGALHCVADLCGDDAEALREMFITYAETWAEKYQRSFLDSILRTDPHCPGFIRTNLVASSTEAFYTAFDVQEGDGMYVAPEDRVGIW